MPAIDLAPTDSDNAKLTALLRLFFPGAGIWPVICNMRGILRIKSQIAIVARHLDLRQRRFNGSPQALADV